MMDDEQLLGAYARDRSESAFGELVARHIDFVYSTALRVVNGDRHLAQDVSQTVFIDPFLLTLRERADKDFTCRASCALGIVRQGASSWTAAGTNGRRECISMIIDEAPPDESRQPVRGERENGSNRRLVGAVTTTRFQSPA